MEDRRGRRLCPRFVARARNGFEISESSHYLRPSLDSSQTGLSLFQPSLSLKVSSGSECRVSCLALVQSSPPLCVWPTYGDTIGHTSRPDTRRNCTSGSMLVYTILGLQIDNIENVCCGEMDKSSFAKYLSSVSEIVFPFNPFWNCGIVLFVKIIVGSFLFSRFSLNFHCSRGSEFFKKFFR